MRHLESLEAQALIHWWTLEANRRKIDHRLLFHIPNGGLRNKVVAMKLKAEGVRAGIPDYLLAITKEPAWTSDIQYSGIEGAKGLFIELKAKKGKTSPAQEEMIKLLENQGYDCCVVHGWQQAKSAIEDYLGPI